MATNAAKLAIQLAAYGDEDVIGKINRVATAGGVIDKRMGTATRQMARFGEAAVRAGTLGGQSLTGMLSVVSDIAFGFGAGGAVVGAVAITTAAIVGLVKKSRDEVKQMKEDFKKTIDDLTNAGDYAALNKKARDILYGTVSDPGGLAALQTQRNELQAKLDKAVKDRNLFLVSKLQQGIDDLNEKIKPIREQYDLVVQRIMTPDLRPGVQGMQGVTVMGTDHAAEAARRLREQAEAARELAAANAALAKASEGITLAGPAVDRGLGSLDNAPVVPVQIEPTFPDTAQAEWIAKLADMAPGIQSAVQQTFGQAIEDGFTAGFTGKNPLKQFGKTLLAGLGHIFMDMGKTLLGFGKIMAALQKFLLNPLTAGPAAIAAGVALVALGAALASIAGGGGAGGGVGGGSFGSGVGEVNAPARITNITIGASGASKTAAGLTPQQPVHFTVIGPGDPQAQRAIVETLDNARRRGLA